MTRVLSVLVLTMNRVDEMQVEAVAQTVSFVLVGPSVRLLLKPCAAPPAALGSACLLALPAC